MNTVWLQASVRAAFFRGLSIRRGLSASDRRVARQTFWMGAIMVVQILGGLAQVSLSARILGPEGFGILAVIIASTSLIHGVLSAPGGDAVTAFVTRGVTEGRPEEAARILRFTLAVSFGLSFISYAVIATLTLTASRLLWIDESYVGATLLYGIVGILMATHMETLSVLRLADRVALGLVITIASTAVRVALIATAWSMNGGLREIVLAHVVGAAVYGVGLLTAAAVSASREGMVDFFRSPSIKVPADVIRFQTGILWRTSIGALNQHLGSILVAQFASVADAGLYRAAQQLIDMTKRPFQAIQAGVQLQYSRQWYSSQGKALRRTAFRVTLLSLALAVTGYGLLVFFRGPIILLLLGAEFSDAGPLLLIMIIGTFPAVSILTLTGLPVAAGRVWPSLLRNILSFMISVGVMLWLLPQHGAVGAAWAKTTELMVFTLVPVPFIVSTLRQSRRL